MTDLPKDLDPPKKEWWETETPEQATAAFRETLQRKRERWQNDAEFTAEHFRAWLKMYVVSLIDGPTRFAAQALGGLLHRENDRGNSLGSLIPHSGLGAAMMATHRALLCLAEFPEIPLRLVESAMESINVFFIRENMEPIAWSIMRFALIPRLGQQGDGEADYLALREHYLQKKAEHEEKRALPEEDADITNDYSTDPSGPTCGEAWLGFLMDWLIMNQRGEDALNLLEEGLCIGDDPCSLCGIGPQVSLALGIGPALDAKREDLARQWLGMLSGFVGGTPQRWLFAAGHRAVAHARLGEWKESLAIIEQGSRHAANPDLSAWNRLWFHHNAAEVLTLAAALDPGDSTLIYRAAHHVGEAQTLATAFDRRNGNTSVSKRFGLAKATDKTKIDKQNC